MAPDGERRKFWVSVRYAEVLRGRDKLDTFLIEGNISTLEISLFQEFPRPVSVRYMIVNSSIHLDI